MERLEAKMKSLIAVFLTMISFVALVSAQTATKSEPVLHVEVENGKTLDLKAADLAKLARRETKAKGHDEKDSIYSGYNLSDVLLAANAKLAAGEMRGKQLAAYVLVEAADGYKVTFAIAEIAPEFTDKVVLLADTRDGILLGEKDGAWQIIVPDEKKHGRWVRQVVSLKVRNVQ